MQGERNVAAPAPPRLRAGAAVESRGGPAPVLEDDRAAAAVLDLAERVEQRPRQRVAAVQPQVDDVDPGQAPADAGREAQPSGNAVPDLGPRRRAPVDRDRALEPGALGRNPAGVVPRVGLVLVRGVVLLVDDDDAEIGDRGEHRGPRADDHAGLPGGDAAVLGAAPAPAEAAVQHRDRCAEPGREPGGDLRRERDLGDEHDRPPPELERVLDEAQVDLGLARPRDAVDEHVAATGLQELDARRDGGLLRGGQLDADIRPGRGRHRLERHQPALVHPPDGGPRRPGGGDQIGERQGREPGVGQDLGLAGGRPLAAQDAHPQLRRAGLGVRGRYERQRPGKGGRIGGGDPLGEVEQREGDLAGDAEQRLQAGDVRGAGERRHHAAHTPAPELDLDDRAAVHGAVELRRHRVVERPVDRARRHKRGDGCDRGDVRPGRAHPGRTPRAAPRRDRCAPRGSPRRCGRNGRRRQSAGRSGGAGRARG